MSPDKQHIFTLLSQLQMLIDTDFEYNENIQESFNVLCTVLDEEIPEDYVATEYIILHNRCLKCFLAL